MNAGRNSIGAAGLLLHGEMCGERLVRSVAARGRNFGSLDAIFKVALEDGWTTTGITSLCSISFSERAGVGVLDLIGEWWQVLGKWTIPGFAFRAHVRLTIRPGEPCFLAELVGVSNSGTKELRISSASFSALRDSALIRLVLLIRDMTWTAGGFICQTETRRTLSVAGSAQYAAKFLRENVRIAARQCMQARSVLSAANRTLPLADSIYIWKVALPIGKR